MLSAFDFIAHQPPVFALYWGLISLSLAAAKIMAAYELMTKPLRKPEDKLPWLVFILFVPIVGAIFYWTKRDDILA